MVYGTVHDCIGAHHQSGCLWHRYGDDQGNEGLENLENTKQDCDCGYGSQEEGK